MKFITTPLTGLLLVEPERFSDDRGYFARTWCAEEFAAAGVGAMVQASVSFSRTAGTLRGLHFQRPPSREGKLVRCVAGAIHDVAVDLRCDSPTFRRSYAVELTRENGLALYIPPGLAHGFLTLAADTEVQYLMTGHYRPELSDGVRWDDPAFGIKWPLPSPVVIADRDRRYPDFPTDGFQGFQGY